MRARGGDREADPLGRGRQLAPDCEQISSRSSLDVGADLRADLDDRLVHLALDLIAERRRARREELGHVRPQVSALGVDDLEFLLDADGEAVHEGDDTSVDSRQSAVVSHSPQSESSVPVVSPGRQSQSSVPVVSPSRQSQSSAQSSVPVVSPSRQSQSSVPVVSPSRQSQSRPVVSPSRQS